VAQEMGAARGGHAALNARKQWLRRKWLRAMRLWEREGGWAVVRGGFIKLYAFLRRRFRSAGSQPGLDPYHVWIANMEPDDPALAQQRQMAEALAVRPLISFITPVYDPPPQVLRATLESVLAQTYSHWELCLADGNSTDPQVKSTLEEFARKDSRIRVEYLESNLGISGNSNRALAMARGEFVALLDHDDLVAPDMLWEVVQTLNTTPQTDIVYFDEDHITADGSLRHLPLFKPHTWSPELLLSTNYLMHSVVRRALVEEMGRFDSAMDGTQDWDLLLRCSEHTDRIVHIPRVLYHWRQLPGSGASGTRKPGAFERQLQCIQAHLQRQGITQPMACFPSPGILRVTWPTQGTKVSIIIPTKDKVKFLRKCLTSLLERTAYPDYEILLIDSGSRERETLDYYETLRQEPHVRLLDFPPPFNYSAANNFGAHHATGDLLLFLNNDIEILEPDWLEELVRWAERPEIGVVGTKLLYADGTIQHAGVVIGMEGLASHIFWDAPEHHCGLFGCLDWYRNYMAVTGACMLMRREVFEAVGGFDEEYILVFSDVKICLDALDKDYRNVYTPFACLCHYEGRSRADSLPLRDLKIAYSEMRDSVEAGDLYFNPNLSYALRLPTLAPSAKDSRDDRLLRLRQVAEKVGLADALGIAETESVSRRLRPRSKKDEG
jgi:GT2 family glycosyltransferase